MIADDRDAFEVRISARVFDDVLEEADENVRLNPDLYENRSHYVRAALIHLNNQHRQERDGGKEAAR